MRQQSVSRRQLLGGMGALAGVAMVPGLLRKGFLAQASNKTDVASVLGLQLYTLGDAPAKDLDGTLRTVADIGYRSVEFPQAYGKTAGELRKALDAAGLVCPAIHATPRVTPGSWDIVDVPKLAADVHAIGASYVVVSIVLLPDSIFKVLMNPPPGFDAATLAKLLGQLTAEDWQRTADLLNEKAAALAKSGIRLAYHNHATDFARLTNGKSGFDILLERTDPKLVDLELDVGWAVAAGQNVPDIFKRAPGRVRLLHLKDIKQLSDNPVELASTDVGTGMVDWKQLFELVGANKVRHLFVEHEPPFATTPLDAITAAYAYLSKNFGSMAVS